MNGNEAQKVDLDQLVESEKVESPAKEMVTGGLLLLSFQILMRKRHD